MRLEQMQQAGADRAKAGDAEFQGLLHGGRPLRVEGQSADRGQIHWV